MFFIFILCFFSLLEALLCNNQTNKKTPGKFPQDRVLVVSYIPFGYKDRGRKYHRVYNRKKDFYLNHLFYIQAFSLNPPNDLHVCALLCLVNIQRGHSGVNNQRHGRKRRLLRVGCNGGSCEAIISDSPTITKLV